MILDGRDIELVELFKKLREILLATLGTEIFIDVIVRTTGDSRKVRAFAAMSGCNTLIEERDGHYVVHISGSACCV
jgi:hypothetical protein